MKGTRMLHAHVITLYQDKGRPEIAPPGPDSEALPQRQSGGWCRRNFACAGYDECLARAAALNWDGFNCEACPGRSVQARDWPERQQADLEPLLNLVGATLNPPGWHGQVTV
jgi:hypothetical protein